ncbi:MAG: indole-3-glycerol-phosphate synthase [Candidatus Syntrophoarchaeum sp.]|nr:indole-3-glycerol-phosphate synthase [Methanomicrobia archaeon]MBL7117628.1 indole-3-glycerol-phosphate synthase [Candidatus Syntrophoarchaeum sp.]
MVEEILKRKHETIDKLKERRSIKEAILERKKAGKRAVIAEVKRRGLKEGEEEIKIEAAEAANRMKTGGACAISVLTDAAFSGSLEDLKTVKLSVELPVLRKDFIFDEFQVHESYAYGANAILLIARFLSAERLKELIKKAHSLGMEALIEIDRESKDKILNHEVSGIASLVGINNRDLETFEVNLATFEEIAPEVKPELPGSILLVAMSGINSKEDARRMFDAGADALLIGTSIMNAADIERKVKDFVIE